MEQNNKTRRTGSIKLTASDAELAAIREHAQTAGLSVAGFLRAAGLRRKISPPIDKTTRLDLSRWSANLNQISHSVNSGNALDRQAVNALRDEARALVAAISSTTATNN